MIGIFSIVIASLSGWTLIHDFAVPFEKKFEKTQNEIDCYMLISEFSTK